MPNTISGWLITPHHVVVLSRNGKYALIIVIKYGSNSTVIAQSNE